MKPLRISLTSHTGITKCGKTIENCANSQTVARREEVIRNKKFHAPAMDAMQDLDAKKKEWLHHHIIDVNGSHQFLPFEPQDH